MIKEISGSNIHVMEQNDSPDGLNIYQQGTEECFLTAHLNGTICWDCPDGWYCGGDIVHGGNSSVNYYCSSGQVSQQKSCAPGACAVIPQQNDICISGDCKGLEDGWFCWNDGVGSGTADFLYFCSGGLATTAKNCTKGCHTAPMGQNDYCTA